MDLMEIYLKLTESEAIMVKRRELQEESPLERIQTQNADQTASPARAYVHPHHPLPTKIKICYNTTTQQKSKITKRTITNQSHSKSKERQGKT